MTRRKTKAVTKTAGPGVPAHAGIPYEIDGRRVSLAEYRAHAREQQRQHVVAELHAVVADPAAYDAALGDELGDTPFAPGDSAA